MLKSVLTILALAMTIHSGQIQAQDNLSEPWPSVYGRNTYQCNFWRASSNIGEYVCSGYPSLTYQLDDQSLLNLLARMKSRIEALEARVQNLEQVKP